MPKLLFYTGTAFCLFLALSSAATALHEIQNGRAPFIAIGAFAAPVTARAAWAIFVSLIASMAAAAIFIRMAALVAARNLFAAFVAVFSVVAAVTSVVWILMLQARMIILMRAGVHDASLRALGEMHLASAMMLGYFVSLMLLALRPYFRIQASRILAILVFLPLPLMLLIVAQEMFVTASAAPFPASSPALVVFFAVVAVLFFGIAMHSVRHRYLFLEMTNLRELLDTRIDPTARATRRAIGDVAYDS
jgi:hypothetical protein